MNLDGLLKLLNTWKVNWEIWLSRSFSLNRKRTFLLILICKIHTNKISQIRNYSSPALLKWTEVPIFRMILSWLLDSHRLRSLNGTNLEGTILHHFLKYSVIKSVFPVCALWCSVSTISAQCHSHFNFNINPTPLFYLTILFASGSNTE